MNQRKDDYDVLIIGGGMVGATLACALEQTSLKIAVLESQLPCLQWPEEGFDLRVSAITRATQNIFTTLGVWPGMQALRVSPFREMHVWDAAGSSVGSGVLHFDSADLGEPYLGHIIENRVILAALHERLATLKNVTLHCPAQAEQILWQADKVQLKLVDGNILNARLVIGADGSRSWVRRQAGISVRGWDYDHSALVTYVKTEHDHRETAWQRFRSDGPLAFLPLNDGYSSIVWSTKPEEAVRLQSLPEDAFCDELETAFEHMLGKILQLGARAVYPLRFFEAEHYIHDRLALVGDAAHTMHPLAGQGVNLGLADVAALAEILTDTCAASKDIGARAVLRQYERWRKADNLMMLAGVDSIKRLFGSELSAVKWARNLGMQVTQNVLPLKNLIMRYAMGLSSDPTSELPKLSRGIMPRVIRR